MASFFNLDFFDVLNRKGSLCAPLVNDDDESTFILDSLGVTSSGSSLVPEVLRSAIFEGDEDVAHFSLSLCIVVFYDSADESPDESPENKETEKKT